MALPTGTISMSQVNVELGRGSTATISLNETAVRNLAGVSSGTISMNNLRGKSAVAFSPDGGTTTGSRVALDAYGSTYAEVTIQCTQNATWTYTGGSGGGASISSGSSSTIITFSVSTSFNPRSASWTVNATSGGVTRYWTVYIEVFGFA